MVKSEAFDESARAGGNLDKALSRIVEVREIIAACGQKPPDFRDGIVGVKALGTRQRRDACECRSPAVRKRKLLLAIGRVEAKECFGHSWIADGEVADFERGDIDIREHRLLQDGLHPRRVIDATVAREIGQVDLVGAGQAKQHIRRHRSLIALQKRDIGGGYIEIGRHVGLGQPQVAPKASQPWSHEDRAGGRGCHDGVPCDVMFLQLYMKIL